MYSPKSCFPIDMKTVDSLYPMPTPSSPGTAHKQDGRRKPGVRKAGRALGVTLSPVVVVGLCHKGVRNSWHLRKTGLYSPQPWPQIPDLTVEVQDVGAGGGFLLLYAAQITLDSRLVFLNGRHGQGS